MSKPKQTICEKFGAKPEVPFVGSKLGIALSTLSEVPINGLRLNEENGTNGWYIWCGGEMKETDDFFSPLHIEHISNYLPEVVEYLDLPPGYRFQIASKGYQDVWLDMGLLKNA